MRALRLRKHFEELADELGVDVILVVDSDYPGECWGMAIQHPVRVGKRAVVLSHSPTTPLSYMVALHELGHCVRGPGWSADLMLDREAAAWEWALERAKLPRRAAALYANQYMDASASEHGVATSASFTRLRRRLAALVQ